MNGLSSSSNTASYGAKPDGRSIFIPFGKIPINLNRFNNLDPPSSGEDLTRAMVSSYAERMAKVDLTRALKKAKLSKRQFSFRLGIDPKNSPRMFRKEFDPRISDLTKYAKAIGCRVRDLIKE